MKIALPRPASLRHKLALAMALMLVPLGLLGAGSFLLLRTTNGILTGVMRETTESLQPVTHLQTVVLEAVNPPHHYLIYADPAEQANFVALSQEVEAAFADLKARDLSPAKLALVTSAEQEWAQVRAASELILGLPTPRAEPITQEEMTAYHCQVAAITASLDQLHELAMQEADAAHAQAQAIVRRAVLFTTLVSLGGLALAVGAALLLARAILRPLRELQRGVASYGAGDFAYRIPLGTPDELGQLAGAFNEMAGRVKESQAALHELATHDGLTGLDNRREFERVLGAELERARRYGQPLVLLMLDLDHFKAFNDTYGHQAGDEALRTVGRLMRQTARATDHAARYGGEELALILPQTPFDSALPLAERLRNAIAHQPFPVKDGQRAHITVSIGIAAFPEDAQFAEELVAAADRALYAAKAGGRNRVCRL